METHRKTLLHLLKERAYKKGNFTLSSGKESEHYINCKPVTLSCEGNALCSHLMIEHVEDNSVAVGGLTLGADPLVCGIVASEQARLAALLSDELFLRIILYLPLCLLAVVTSSVDIVYKPRS